MLLMSLRESTKSFWNFSLLYTDLVPYSLLKMLLLSSATRFVSLILLARFRDLQELTWWTGRFELLLFGALITSMCAPVCPITFLTGFRSIESIFRNNTRF